MRASSKESIDRSQVKGQAPVAPSRPDGCAMCSALSGAESSAPWNVPVLESENFVVIPSLGPIVEGWLLVVPKQHVLSMAVLEDQSMPELSTIKSQVSNLLESLYGPVTFFEHGPSSKQKSTGCSVDHAHLHAVSNIHNLAAHAEQILRPLVGFQQGTLADCSEAVSSGLDYLHIEARDTGSVYLTAESFPSQVLRQAIAQANGTPDGYDWRTFPNLDLITSFLAKLRPLSNKT